MKNDLTEAQLQTLREELQGHHLEAMMLLAIDIGIRRDELRRLTWPKVDLETGEMHVLNEKTKSHIRRICLPENLVHVLRQHALRQEKQNRDADTARPHLGLVFPDSTGGELSTPCFLQEWHEFCKHVGLSRRHFHDLRVLVWCRLLTQERETREGRDGTKDDLNKNTNGEESHYGQA